VRSVDGTSVPHEGITGEGSDLGRLLALSDGIFAFSMTLLVISLALPSVTAGGTRVGLIDYLYRLRSPLLSYAVAFLVISTWWLGHHRIFSAIRKYDFLLVRLNTLLLLVISISPFILAIMFNYGPSSILSTDTSAKIAVGLFAAVELVTGVVLLAIWRHATAEHRLVDPQLSPEWIRYAEQLTLRPILIFAVSLGIALVLPWFAQIAWIGVAFIRRSTPRAAPRAGPTE
jgi:uncharacterized membrane protein